MWSGYVHVCAVMCGCERNFRILSQQFSPKIVYALRVKCCFQVNPVWKREKSVKNVKLHSFSTRIIDEKNLSQRKSKNKNTIKKPTHLLSIDSHFYLDEMNYGPLMV